MEKQELLELIGELNPASQSAVIYGYVRQINPHDIAYCLSQIKENGPSYYGRLKFADQQCWAKDAAYFLTDAILVRMPGYKTPKAFIGKDMLRRIAEASIWEHMGNTLCPTCNGRGDFHPPDSPLITCPTCDGHRVVSAASNRHRVFNMDKNEWVRWNPIYLESLRILDRWQGLVLSVLVKNLGRWVLDHYLAVNVRKPLT